jgi:histidinol dehydrogenase
MNPPIVKDLRNLEAVPPEFLRRTEADLSAYLPRVEAIIQAVRARGDDALIEFARELDKVSSSDYSLRTTPEEFDAAHPLVSAEVQAAIAYAADNIRRFHEA